MKKGIMKSWHLGIVLGTLLITLFLVLPGYAKTSLSIGFSFNAPAPPPPQQVWTYIPEHWELVSAPPRGPYVWKDGYWDKSQSTWMPSGWYSSTPKSRKYVWVDGYYDDEDGLWYDGHWAKKSPGNIVLSLSFNKGKRVPAPPPEDTIWVWVKAHYELVPAPPPGPYEWRNGYWDRRNGWVPPAWTWSDRIAPAGNIWIDPYWDSTRRVWVRGHYARRDSNEFRLSLNFNQIRHENYRPGEYVRPPEGRHEWAPYENGVFRGFGKKTIEGPPPIHVGQPPVPMKPAPGIGVPPQSAPPSGAVIGRPFEGRPAPTPKPVLRPELPPVTPGYKDRDTKIVPRTENKPAGPGKVVNPENGPKVNLPPPGRPGKKERDMVVPPGKPGNPPSVIESTPPVNRGGKQVNPETQSPPPPPPLSQKSTIQWQPNQKSKGGFIR